MTVLEVIQKSTAFLAKFGVESPRLQVELLLSHVLAIPRLNLYLNFERALDEATLDRLREMVQRRAKREPLQHIVGSTHFCGLELTVNKTVLVPRPETEILAERAWEWLGRRQPTSAITALDLCTGGGCLAIAIAAHCATVRVTATDLSPEALEVAGANAARHQVSSNIQWRCGDLFRALDGESPFDLIVSNPPYIPSRDIDGLEPEVKDYDPRLALDGGADGLDFYRRLAGEGRKWLKADGLLMTELGDGQAGAASEIFKNQNWVVREIVPDYSPTERFLIAGHA